MLGGSGGGIPGNGGCTSLAFWRFLSARGLAILPCQRMPSKSLMPTIRVSRDFRHRSAVASCTSVRSMPDERSLRDTAREAIRTGRLPARPPSRTLAGPGSGEACVLCGETIGHDQMEVELEYARRAGDTIDIERHRLHPPCCIAWESARFEATSD